MKRKINKLINWGIATGLCLLGFASCRQFGGNAPRIYGPPPQYKQIADTTQNNSNTSADKVNNNNNIE